MDDAQIRWITLDGAVNVRDLGGLPTTTGATTRYGRLLRSDNLQGLTPADVTTLTADIGLRHVIDLRSDAEVELEGPGPLTRVPEVTIHHLSLFTEGGRHTDVEADLDPDPATGPAPTIDADKILPWQTRTDRQAPEHERSVDHYLGYLAERPDSIVNALRVVAHNDGASIVHCAAGKDRTGVVTALALEAVGVERAHTVADYVRTGDRLEAILGRLRASTTYAADLDARPADTHLPLASIMEKFLAILDERHGGPLGWLTAHGWTDEDQKALASRLLHG